jgi:hypothetical protein
LQIVKDRYSLSILAGSILVLLGFSVWLYAQSVVSGLRELTVASATPEEMHRYFGALRWWRLQQASLLNPMAAILIVIGIILVVNAFFWLTKRTVTARLEYQI